MTGLVAHVGAVYRARHSVRARLALLYAGAFFVSGLVLLAIPAGFVHAGSSSSAVAVHPTSIPPSAGAGIATSQHRTDVHYLIVGSLVAIAVLVFVSAVLGWVIAGRLLRPLRTITETARDISATNLHRRLALSGPDEFQELGQTLDGLFERLEASFDSQRRFVANASHELRTPLTAERTVLQVALADPTADTGALRAACEQVIDLGHQQERLIDALLTLARSDRGIESSTACDLSQIVETVLARHRFDIDSAELQVVATLGHARVIGDRQLLDSLVTNLVDNAIRHNQPGGRIELATASVDGRTTLSVGNTGPVVPPGEVDRLFQPFQRLATDRTNAAGGHGLGLAIVHAIVDAHSATIRALPRPSGGLDIDITLPTRH